jgi:hypothetical protein
MRQKDLSYEDRVRFNTYREYFLNHITTHGITLSHSSVKLYARNVSLVAVCLLPSEIEQVDIDTFLEAIIEKYDIKSNIIECIEIDQNLNNNNQILNAIGKLIEFKIKEDGDIDDKLSVLHEHIKSRSKSIREAIVETKSRNQKTEEEEKHMKSFPEYVKVAEDYFKEYEDIVKDSPTESIISLLPKLKFRNIILVSLILLNKTKVEGKTLHSILRLVEYTDLYLWKLKKKPPLDGKNYLSLHHKKIFLQHNKTTGGMASADKEQEKLKTFKIFNPKLIEMITIYSELYEIENDTPLFTSSYKPNSSTQKAMNKTGLSKLLKTMFKSISQHTNVGMIRKSYDTYNSKNLDMNGKKYLKSAKLNDHSVETIEVFYKKID